MSEDHVPRKRPRKLGLFLACGVCAGSLAILISRAAWLIDVPRSGGHAFGVKPVEQFPKRRIDGEHRFLWASGSIDPVQPDSEWFGTVIDMLGLEDRLHHRPTELSGGQQPRVAAARALVSRPEIIFADEPSGNLDSKSGTELLAFMRRAVRELGQTIVMVTHDPLAASYADRVVFLADGKVVDQMDDPTQASVIDRTKILGG